jgi:hypothetical protein
VSCGNLGEFSYGPLEKLCTWRGETYSLLDMDLGRFLVFSAMVLGEKEGVGCAPLEDCGVLGERGVKSHKDKD